ncbi:MAG: HAD family phosphatase [Ignavibacteria bacterium]|jgi:HAD superfamily hydrolase (TIGR01509 family)
MIKAIFFDNDGILVDTEKLYFQSNKIILKEFGIELTTGLYIENYLKRSKGTWHFLKKLGVSDEDIIKLRDKRNNIYNELLKHNSIKIEGVEETLQYLYGKYKLVIVTSSRRDHFETIHSNTGLLKYFDFTLTSDECPVTKPDPLPYLTALKQSGFKKEECIIVEDSERGLKSAIAAGIKCYVIPTELTKNSDFTGAGEILNYITEIKNYL